MRSVPSDLWDKPQMRAALATRDISTVFWLLREVISQRHIAMCTGCSQSEVSEICNGRQVISYDVLARIADGLGIPRGYMGLAGMPIPVSRTEPQAIDEVTRRRELMATAIAAVTRAPSEVPEPMALETLTEPLGAVTITDLDAAEHALGALRDLDQSLGGVAARPAAVAVTSRLSLIAASSDLGEGMRRRVLELLARADLLVAWIQLDCGDTEECRTHMARALTTARDAENTKLLTHVLYGSGRALLHQRKPADALRLLQLAEVHATGVQHAVLSASQAWALAELDAGELVPRRLRQADEAFALGAAGGPAWLSWFGTADHAAVTGATCAVVGDFDRAIADTQVALAHRGAAEARPMAFELGTLTLCQLRAGELDEAMATGGELLDQVGQLRSVRVQERLAPLVKEANDSGDSTVRDFGRELRDRVPAS
ncbi:Helix-turn-helix domain-containing protein [Saccharopolyspora shandongensis]|uniref:Helix-turn-helix domain-containing protein n=1 Tax=Saccharopolyspora shandongensis TaxID=418495 RepID=A0A1H3G7X8_9PSEU|nr:helix-turn-helix transcriptional regulator [Saccharopolyspora shandongensis]SDX99443.1 Helix-turn-helix domain-containing protein [Saccharopolyspora shandongensis]